MKKNVIAAIALSSLAVIACKKEDPATPAEPGTCTISGVIDAPLDMSNDTLDNGTFVFNETPEYPASAKVTIVIDSEDLDHNPDASYDYKDLTFNTTISSTDGTYSIEVPAISTPLTAEVYFDEFYMDQRQYIAANPDSMVYNNNTRFFLNATSIGNITEGATIVRNFTYNF